jgi:hypothetical protein
VLAVLAAFASFAECLHQWAPSGETNSMKSFSYVLATLVAIAFAVPSIASAKDAKPMMHHHHHMHHHMHHHHHMMDKKM